MLAGPSEVLVIADESANFDVIAAGDSFLLILSILAICNHHVFYILDLLAQAEHDTEARPILGNFLYYSTVVIPSTLIKISILFNNYTVCTSLEVANQVNIKLQERLAALPTAPTARVAMEKGFACVCPGHTNTVIISVFIIYIHMHFRNTELNIIYDSNLHIYFFRFDNSYRNIKSSWTR